MNKEQFEKLIQSITGRSLFINTTDSEIVNGKEYTVCKFLPITERYISFTWKAALTEEKLLRSFITAFTTKYKEPDPAAYETRAPYFAPNWEARTEKEREYAYGHHSSNMYGKAQLLKQVEENFNSPEIEKALLQYGFYNTEYGVGIFCFWETQFVVNAINKMKEFLKANSIPFANEFSDARWVFRFKLNLNKEMHLQILQSFANTYSA